MATPERDALIDAVMAARWPTINYTDYGLQGTRRHAALWVDAIEPIIRRKVASELHAEAHSYAPDDKRVVAVLKHAANVALGAVRTHRREGR